ncbi:MAG: hypothetical protein PF440_04270 [Thiomicrorhabdus sp.]|jgi:hypothetical protein|nr:hypothetical protein [Thiomicrorhabdus sp.]
MNEQDDTKMGAILGEHGAFFAFNMTQYNTKAVEGTEYVNMGQGLVCPEDNAEALVNALAEFSANLIKEDKEANSIEAIVQRELANHEAQITGSIEPTVEALFGYDIPLTVIHEEFNEYMSYCIENDLF